MSKCYDFILGIKKARESESLNALQLSRSLDFLNRRGRWFLSAYCLNPKRIAHCFLY